MKVLDSIENRAGDHCDARGWFSLHHYSHLVFKTQDEAVVEANLKVAWMERRS